MLVLVRVLRRLRALAAWTPARLALFAVVALVGCWPWLAHAAAFNDFRDAQVLFAYERDAVSTVRAYHQLPMWDPYYCGGISAFGTPQGRFVAPTFLLSLLFGAQRAQALTAFLLAIVGMEGFYRLAKSRTASALGPVIVAPVFALNGFFAMAYFNGWINFFGFELIPWALFGLERIARRDARGVAVAALAFAFIAGFGGTYAGPLTALFGALWLLSSSATTLRQALRRGSMRPLGHVAALAALAAFFGAGVAAVRLWPVAETMLASPRVMAGTPAFELSAMKDALFSAPQVFPDGSGIADSFYVGFAGIGLAAFALLGRVRRTVAPLGLAALSVALATGHSRPSAPFALLRALPLFSALRYPERFLFFACLFVLVAAAVGLDRLVLLARKRAWLGALFVVPIALATLATASQCQVIADATSAMPFAPPPSELHGAFHQARGNRWMASYYGPLNLGSLSCWEAFPVAQSPELRGDLPKEEYLADASAGTVDRVSWSPNRIELRAQLQRPAVVRINQNWHPGWHSSAGSVVSENGLLAVALPAGEHAFSLRFRPRSVLGGLLVSLVSLVALLIFARSTRSAGHGAPRPRRGAPWPAQGRRLALLLAPLAAWGLSRVALTEPPMPAPVLRNANEAPMVVAALPPGATALPVEFGVPVRLEGALVPTRADARDQWSLELFFRVVGRVPKSVGVFIHLEGPDGQAILMDHDVIASSVYFSGAPRDVILRDATSLALPPGPGLWRVYAGLWHMTGNQSRVKVRSAPGVTVDDDRVLVGTIERP